MNTKLIMTSSALLLGAAGILLSFLPQEVFNLLSGSMPSQLDTVILQIMGALYFASSMTNWTAKANLIGGIYARPIAIGNLTHFTIATFALLKAYVSGLSILLVPTIVYLIMAVAFGIMLFTHPLKSE